MYEARVVDMTVECATLSRRIRNIKAKTYEVPTVIQRHEVNYTCTCLHWDVSHRTHVFASFEEAKVKRISVKTNVSIS